MKKSFITHLLGKVKINLIDVGSSGGIHNRWDTLGRNINVFCVEPDNDERLKLEKSHPEYHVISNAVTDKSYKSKDFFVTYKQECSSLLRPNKTLLEQFPNSSRFEINNKISVTTSTIDSIQKNSNIPDLDVLKIDAQGASFPILKGAEETLKDNVLVVEIEAEHIELYKNEKLIYDIGNLLSKNGFIQIDINPIYWKYNTNCNYPGKQLVFGDFLFIKSPELLTSEDKIKKLIACLAAYGYFDFAEFLCQRLPKINAFEEQLASFINTYKFSDYQFSKFNNDIFTTSSTITRIIDLFYSTYNGNHKCFVDALENLKQNTSLRDSLKSNEEPLKTLRAKMAELNEKAKLERENHAERLTKVNEQNKTLRDSVKGNEESLKTLRAKMAELTEKAKLERADHTEMLNLVKKENTKLRRLIYNNTSLN